VINLHSILKISNAICLVPALAIILDMLIGDPPNRWHPVAWIGSAIFGFRRIAPKKARLIPLLCGIVFILLGSGIIGAIFFLLMRLIHVLPFPVALIIEASLLKLALPVRGLKKAANEVYEALKTGDLNEARRLVAWHLVSRDTNSLEEGHVASATIESVAENLGDGIVGPIFWWVLGGLPGVWIYRFINTSDSILGYRTPGLEWLGKVPARLDDIANFVPARLSALLLVLSTLFMKISPVPGIRIMFRDHSVTSSPNAGWPMSAMAGILNVKLEKIGNYTLNQDSDLPMQSDISRSVFLMQIAACLCVMLGFVKLLYI
jgi:adenosylcobinamide-phosphate synthase